MSTSKTLSIFHMLVGEDNLNLLLYKYAKA